MKRKGLLAFDKVAAMKSMCRTFALMFGGKECAARWDEQVAKLDAMTEEEREAWTDEQMRVLHEQRQKRNRPA
jgi:hypothetical protein